ncbi:unnamed protein product [Closterium sp. Naga37s-1]|nr:unnamed protein product [Closterium sp. Naga37s-1]
MVADELHASHETCKPRSLLVGVGEIVEPLLLLDLRHERPLPFHGFVVAAAQLVTAHQSELQIASPRSVPSEIRIVFPMLHANAGFHIARAENTRTVRLRRPSFRAIRGAMAPAETDDGEAADEPPYDPPARTGLDFLRALHANPPPVGTAGPSACSNEKEPVATPSASNPVAPDSAPATVSVTEVGESSSAASKKRPRFAQGVLPFGTPLAKPTPPPAPVQAPKRASRELTDAEKAEEKFLKAQQLYITQWLPKFERLLLDKNEEGLPILDAQASDVEAAAVEVLASDWKQRAQVVRDWLDDWQWRLAVLKADWLGVRVRRGEGEEGELKEEAVLEEVEGEEEVERAEGEASDYEQEGGTEGRERKGGEVKGRVHAPNPFSSLFPTVHANELQSQPQSCKDHGAQWACGHQLSAAVSHVSS